MLGLRRNLKGQQQNHAGNCGPEKTARAKTDFVDWFYQLVQRTIMIAPRLKLPFDHQMQQVEKRHTYKNDNRNHWVSFFFVIDLWNQVACGDVESNTG
jgi:hypothetical protein